MAPRRPLHRRAGRAALRCLQTALTLAAVAVAALAVLVTVAQHRALPVGDWLERAAGARIEARLARQGLTGQLGSFDLTLAPGLVPVVTARDIRLIRAGETEPLVRLDSARIAFHRDQALLGRIRPRVVQLEGLRIVAAVEGQGVSLGADRAPVLEAVKRPGEAVQQFGALLDRPGLERLENLGITDIDLRVEDRVDGLAWHSRSGDLHMVRAGDRLTLDATLSGPGEGPQTGTVQLSASAALTGDRGTLTLRARGIRPGQMLPGEGAGLDPGAMPLADVPVSLDLAGELRGDGLLSDLTGRLAFGDGRIALPAGQTVLVEGGSARLTVDSARNRVVLDDLRFASDRARLAGRVQLIAEAAGADRHLAGLVLQATLQDVRLDAGAALDEPVTIDRLDTALRLGLPARRIELGPTVLETGGSSVTAEGWVQPPAAADTPHDGAPSREMLPDGWQASLDLAADRLDTDLARRLWPRAIEPQTRDWVVGNVRAGQIEAARLSLRLAETGKPDTGLTFRFEGGEVWPDPGLPPVTGAAGFFSLAQQRLEIAIDRAGMTAPDGGAVAIAEALVSKPDVRVKTAPLSIDGRASAAAGSALSLVALPLIVGAETRMPLDPADLQGQAEVALHLAVPTGPGHDPKDLDYRASGRIADVATTQLIPGRRTASPALTLELDRGQVAIGGPVTLDGHPATVRWTRALGPGADPVSTVAFDAALTRALAGALGVALTEREMSGTGRVSGAVRLAPGQPAQLDLTGDLTAMVLHQDGLGWSKPAGRPATLRLAGRLGAAPVFERLSLEAPGLLAEGGLSLAAAGGLERLSLERLRVGDWLDARLVLRPETARRMAVEVSGGKVDLAGLPKGGGGQSPIGKVDLRLDRVQVAPKLALTRVSGTLDLSKGTAGEVAGHVNGGAPVRVSLTPGAGGPAIRIRSTDAGRVAQDAGMFRQASGGALDLRLTPAGGAASYQGTLRGTDITITEAPTALSVLSAISIVGIAEQMGEGGVHFGRVDAEFLLTPDRLVIAKSSATGPSLGLSLDGGVNLKGKTLDMQGVISPFFFLNRIGSGMTRRGEGLLGITFTVTGGFDAPKVGANPLSILAPGVFRDLFRRKPPEIGDQP